MKVDICFSPALYPFYRKDNETVIIVDIFRASTTICAMLTNGASAVIPVADIEDAKLYKSQGYLVGAERNAKRCEFADFGNSPFDYTREIVTDKEIVFTTTNGTQAIDAAKNCNNMFIGAFSNISALAEKCLQLGEDILVLCAGWNNTVNIEDMLFGSALIEELGKNIDIEINSDAVKIANHLWSDAKENPIDFLRTSEHYKRLVMRGAEKDIEFCFLRNTTSIVPYYNKETKKIII